MPDLPGKTDRIVSKSGYALVNGLEMYYEIEGHGKPLVYVPPAFGYAGVKYFPDLNKIRTVITPDLQGAWSHRGYSRPSNHFRATCERCRWTA